MITICKGEHPYTNTMKTSNQTRTTMCMLRHEERQNNADTKAALSKFVWVSIVLSGAFCLEEVVMHSETLVSMEFRTSLAMAAFNAAIRVARHVWVWLHSRVGKSSQ